MSHNDSGKRTGLGPDMQSPCFSAPDTSHLRLEPISVFALGRRRRGGDMRRSETLTTTWADDPVYRLNNPARCASSHMAAMLHKSTNDKRPSLAANGLWKMTKTVPKIGIGARARGFIFSMVTIPLRKGYQSTQRPRITVRLAREKGGLPAHRPNGLMPRPD
jgi:hypothetical protein